MATKKTASKATAPQRLEYDYMRLDTLLAHRWDLNPKLHQAAAIHQSITDYGFNDPVGFDTKWNLVLEGHGRLEDLDARYRARKEASAEAVPQHIDVDPKDGMWLVPVTKKQFPSREVALLYALAHNRTNTARYVPEDYDPVKMDKIRKMLGDAGQMQLAGFGVEDAIGSGVSSLGNFDLPDMKPFDSIDLPDGAGVDGSAPEAFVISITFRTFMEMKEALRVLTMGERFAVSQTTRWTKFEGSHLLATWRAMMAGEGLAQTLEEAKEEHQAAAEAPLLNWAESQSQESDPAWQELGAPTSEAVEMVVAPPPSPSGYVATEMEVAGTEEPAPAYVPNTGAATNLAPVAAGGAGVVEDVPDWDNGVPLGDDFFKDYGAPAKKSASAKKATAPSGPKWVGGLCKGCGGNGSKGGNPKNGECPDCEGYGDEDAYNQRNVAKQGSLL